MPNRPEKPKKIIYTFSVDKKTTKEVENIRKNKETGKEEKVITAAKHYPKTIPKGKY